MRRPGRPAVPVEERLWQRCRFTDDGCWEFEGHRSAAGYGRIWSDGRDQRAHRVAYELAVGPIPDGLVLDHLCRNRACVNPDHLEAVTSAENTRRGVGQAVLNAAKTHCPQGHEYTPENTYIKSSRGSRRVCRTCQRIDREKRRTARRRLEEPAVVLTRPLILKEQAPCCNAERDSLGRLPIGFCGPHCIRRIQLEVTLRETTQSEWEDA